MKKTIILVLMTFLTIILTSQASVRAISMSKDTDSHIVIVSAKTLNFINSLGPDIVFFTSREHPINNITDINDGSQFGVWGPGPGASIQDLMTLQNTVTGTGGLHMVGNGHFGNLFIELPQLKLFATFRSISGVSSIESTGGGIRVRFVESK